MPQGSDPRRRPDRQSKDSGASVPPSWWQALSEQRLPNEGPRPKRRRDWGASLERLAQRFGAAAVALAVCGLVVAVSFGYQVVGIALGALLVVSVGGASLIHRKRAGRGDRAWWR
ncbi:MAG: hypothetical protein ACREN7_09850 [Candidatus Dormibacteria bacterium]